ncbi:MAG: preprotein translocase subunit SecG [bacterium]
MGVTILTILHYLLCFGLILIVLLQAGKGGGLASAFGGGSSETIFGTRRGNILTRTTAIGVGIFMVTSLLLTIILPRQASLIQKKGLIGEEQMQDVKMPKVPGVPIGVPPAGQEAPVPLPPEAPATPKVEEQAPPATQIPQQTPPQVQEPVPQPTPVPKPPEAPVTQPPAQKTPAQPEVESPPAKPEVKESIPLAPVTPEGANE